MDDYTEPVMTHVTVETSKAIDELASKLIVDREFVVRLLVCYALATPEVAMLKETGLMGYAECDGVTNV